MFINILRIVYSKYLDYDERLTIWISSWKWFNQINGFDWLNWWVMYVLSFSFHVRTVVGAATLRLLQRWVIFTQMIKDIHYRDVISSQQNNGDECIRIDWMEPMKWSWWLAKHQLKNINIESEMTFVSKQIVGLREVFRKNFLDFPLLPDISTLWSKRMSHSKWQRTFQSDYKGRFQKRNWPLPRVNAHLGKSFEGNE